MTAKEKLLERVMTFSETEADEALRLLDARRDEAEREWDSLSRLHEVAFGDSMRHLAESERAAGQEPWWAAERSSAPSIRAGTSPGRGDGPRRGDRLPPLGPLRPGDHHDPGARTARGHQRDQQQDRADLRQVRNEHKTR